MYSYTQEELEAQVSFLQGQINDLEAMSKYCAKMMNMHIGESLSQSVISALTNTGDGIVIIVLWLMDRKNSRSDTAGASREGRWGSGVTCWTKTGMTQASNLQKKKNGNNKINTKYYI